MSAGYGHADYARSFAALGTPRALHASGGWLIQRDIPLSAAADAMGCYPLFCCNDWEALRHDLDGLGRSLVSVTVVTDPFGAYDPEHLRRCFPHAMRPFKQHFVVDLEQRLCDFVHPHHRRYARRALERVEVEVCSAPMSRLDEWHALYECLIVRRSITGVAAFSRSAFALQLGVPGLTLFRAYDGMGTVGMALWYVHGDLGYYHLAAYNDMGYRLRASFALFWTAIEHFAARGLRWLNLGAGAGLTATGDEGLTRFKRGWATGTRTAYLCGRIFAPVAYRELSLARGASAHAYFPAYRAGEFGSSTPQAGVTR